MDDRWKRSLVLAVVLVVCAVEARASDTRSSSDSANVGAPWGGFYAGSIVGYGVGASSYSAWPFAWPASSRVALYGQDGQFGPVTGGLQLGYNHILPFGVLLGVQTSLQFPDRMNSNLPIFYPSNGSSVVNDEIQLFGAVKGRLGYVYRDWLFYAAGGFAYDRDHMVSTDGAGDVDLGYVWRAGWTAGGLAELPRHSIRGARIWLQRIFPRRQGSVRPQQILDPIMWAHSTISGRCNQTGLRSSLAFNMK